MINHLRNHGSTNKMTNRLIERFKLWLRKNKNCKHCCLCCEHYEECKDEFEWQKEDVSPDTIVAIKHSRNYLLMHGSIPR